MQPGSMVSIGPIQSIQVDQSVHTHSHGYGHLGIGGGGAGMGYNAEMADMHTHHNNHNHSHHHNQQLLPYEHRLSARMDDLLDQMFSLSPPPPPPPPPSSSSSSSWYEITGMNNNNNAANGALPMESTEQAQEDIGGGGGLPLRSPSGDWCQPYMSGLLSMNHTPKPETFMLHNGMDANLIGKRPRQDDICAEATGSYLGPSQVCRVAMGQASRQHSMESKPHIQGGQSVPVAYHGTPQPPNTSTGAPARPRVRARRGQATDPHSIAERLRRERIAERMKALQELVPNSNKTDKASMLDEIIEYVKFLQLQVKVLSMSRLGSASAVAPLIADLPLENNLGESTLNRMAGTSASSQDAMAAFERQVAQLLEEDMGSCMQFLQLKGLCLMPISLASAVSSTGTWSQTGINPSADMSSSSITTVSCGKALTTVQPSSGSDRASSDSSIKGANAVRSLNPDK